MTNAYAHPGAEMEFRSTTLVLLLSSSLEAAALNDWSIVPAGGCHNTNAIDGFSLHKFTLLIQKENLER